MPLPGKSLVLLEATPNYRRVSRCVSHAFLYGEVATSRSVYEYRRAWIESRLLHTPRERYGTCYGSHQ